MSTGNELHVPQETLDRATQNGATLHGATRQGVEEAHATRPFIDRYDQPWLGSIVRPLLIVTLVACLAVALVAFIRRFSPELPAIFSTALTLLAILAGTVGALSTTVLAQPSFRLSRSAALRLAELGLFLIGTRLLVWSAATGYPSLEQMIEEPLLTFVSPLFLVSAFIVTFAWWTAAEVTDDFNQLGLGSDELYVAEMRSDRTGDPMRSSGIDRRAVLTAFAMRWVTLGLMLILLAATLRQGMRFNGLFALIRQDIEPGILAAIIVYFLAGLLLLSHGQLALLRSRWTLERLPSTPAVIRRWSPLVAGVIVGSASLALFLPFGGTFVLATALSAIITGLFVALLAAYRLLLYVLVWVSTLFGVAPPELPPAAPAMATAPETAPAPALAVQLPEWVGAGLFWLALILLCLYALRLYLSDRDVRFGWLAWLLATLRRRWGEWQDLMRQTQRRFNRSGTRKEQTAESSLSARWRLLLRGDPDHQVRTLYLAALRNAADAGIERQRAETPAHFASRLNGALEGEIEKSDAVRSLTDAFVEVRYAGRHTTQSHARALHEKWKALHKALRMHRVGPADARNEQEDSSPSQVDSR